MSGGGGGGGGGCGQLDLHRMSEIGGGGGGGGGGGATCTFDRPIHLQVLLKIINHE